MCKNLRPASSAPPPPSPGPCRRRSRGSGAAAPPVYTRTMPLCVRVYISIHRSINQPTNQTNATEARGGTQGRRSSVSRTYLPADVAAAALLVQQRLGQPVQRLLQRPQRALGAAAVGAAATAPVALPLWSKRSNGQHIPLSIHKSHPTTTTPTRTHSPPCRPHHPRHSPPPPQTTTPRGSSGAAAAGAGAPRRRGPGRGRARWRARC